MGYNDPKFRKRRFKILLSIIFVFLILACSIFLVQYKNYRELLLEKERLTETLDTLTKENQELQSEVEFSSSTEFMEYIARQLLGWLKPGETKYVDGD